MQWKTKHTSHNQTVTLCDPYLSALDALYKSTYTVVYNCTYWQCMYADITASCRNCLKWSRLINVISFCLWSSKATVWCVKTSLSTLTINYKLSFDVGQLRQIMTVLTADSPSAFFHFLRFIIKSYTKYSKNIERKYKDK